MSLASIYDREFFRQYGAANPSYAQACRRIATEIHRRLQPRHAIDWGCGAGLHAEALAAQGTEVLAVDGVEVDADLRATGVTPVVADLREPVTPPTVFEQYDLSLCIDVLEHIHEEHADQVLTNVTRGSQVVVLSCAPPGQGGHHHVNEQPRRYWIAKMHERGWYYQRRETGAMDRFFMSIRDQLPSTWMFHNLCIYRPTPPPSRPKHRLPNP